MRFFVAIAALVFIISSVMLAAHGSNFLGFADVSIANETIRTGLVLFTLFGPFIAWPIIATALMSRIYDMPNAWRSLPLQYIGMILFELIAVMTLPWNMIVRSADSIAGDTVTKATTHIPDIAFFVTMLVAPIAVLYLIRALSSPQKV
jgi:hypothetical protein